VSTAVVPVALTRYNTDERLTRVTPEFCLRTISEVEKLQKEFRRELGTTFAFLGDEIYIKAGADIPSRRHYGNYPQIEDGVGMVRSFLTKFESMLRHRSVPPASAGGRMPVASIDHRTHAAAILPTGSPTTSIRPPANAGGTDLYGTILTGEMFAPILREQIDRFNCVTGSRLHVLGVPNTYFGGDVSVAGLLSGQDYRNVADKIEGDFAIIPKHTIKSDEPILLDGTSFEELKSLFSVPVYDLDINGLMDFLA
jgi:NifB/MoaA-like Fe-S oxidoreductase